MIDRLAALARADGLWHPRDCAAGTELFALAEPSSQFWILERGLIKLGYLTANGEDWIKSFIVDQGLFTGSGDLSPDGTNRYGATCLEPSRVAALPLAWVGRQIEESATLQGDFVRFAAWLQARKQRREELLLCASAEQRYRDLLEQDGALAARLRQAYIARYIGITPIALSRIRRRMGLSGKAA